MGILDCYRFKQGVPLRGAYPVIVTFKARREKEQILWRAKDKLRKKEIFVTEDSQARLSERLRQFRVTEKEKEKPSKGMKKSQSTTFDFPSSPAKKWPPNNPGSLANSPKKKASQPRTTGPTAALLNKIPPTKSLSAMELEDLFDML